MREYTIGENEAGQRFDKYLGKLLRDAPKSFFYRMLRKKNITLNGKKASGGEKLVQGDLVKLFLSDETIDKFAGKSRTEWPHAELDIIYEDHDTAIINKPAGMLSQRAEGDEDSLVEYFIGYLIESGVISEDDLATFRPSICNRLDRNTSGMICAGKTLAGLQRLSAAFHNRSLHKYYLCPVKGVVKQSAHIRGYLCKDADRNISRIFQEEREGASFIETGYRPLGNNGRITLLEVALITGRPHQIRAHLAGIGHPILGDAKYGDISWNRQYRQKYGLKHQLLHAYRLEFPKEKEMAGELAGKIFLAPVPALFHKILQEEQLEESYYENMG